MKSTGNLKLMTQGDSEIVMTRALDAPRRLVFDAYTKPDLLKQWLLGPPGWSMPICEIDLRVGGVYRYVWRRDSDGSEMGMGGIARSRPRSGWSPPRSLTSRGIPVRRLARPSSLSKAERPRSHRRYSTNRKKPAMRSSRVAWSAGSPRATTGLRICWHRWGPQACGRERASHERNPPSATYWSKHRRPVGRHACGHHSHHRHRHGAARNRRFPAMGPVDGRLRRGPHACDDLSHSLRRRGQLHHRAARARSAHAARLGGRRRGPCREYFGRRRDMEQGTGLRAPLVSSRARRTSDAASLGGRQTPPHAIARTR